MKCFAGLIFVCGVALAQLPAGEGKAITEKICTSCHGAESFMGLPLSKGGWEKTIESMINRGAEGTDAQFDAIIAYLTKSYSPKVNVNKAPALELADKLDLTKEVAGAVVGYREKNGAFKGLEDLKKVPGIEAAEIEARKSQVEF